MIDHQLLLVALAPSIGTDEARHKLRAVCVANQLRPRLVALLRREVLPELQQTVRGARVCVSFVWCNSASFAGR